MEFAAYETKYKNFYAPRFAVTVGGVDLAASGVEIVSVTVDQTLDAAAQATFTVSNAFDIVKREVRWFDQEIAAGKQVEVRMGYTDRLELMFVGSVTAIKTAFPSSGMPQLEVTAFDLSHPMGKTKKSVSWDGKKDSDVARALASAYGLTAEVEDTRQPHASLKQDNQSDFDFLRKRAQENSFEFFVFGRSLFFRAPAFDESAVVSLEWSRSLIGFAPELDVADQVEEVEVRGWDPKAKREIVGRARAGDEEGRDRDAQSGGERVAGGSGERIVERVRRPVRSREEADKLAKAVLARLAEGLVKGSGECLGIPELRCGRNVGLAGIGRKLSKTYYVEKTNHSISGSGYRTTFNVKEPTL